MTERNAEYDRFGPWVIEISDEDPPPPLFLPYLTRTDPTLLSVKIPRKIERRRANPGMDLYDYMVCLYEADMMILQRVGHEVSSEAFSYRDVRQVRVSEHLLRGNVHLGLPGRSYDVPFSTVSQQTMLRLVDLIRERYAGGNGNGPPGTTPPVAGGGLSFYFERLIAMEEVSGSAMRLVAAQAETAVGSRDTNAARRLFFGIAGKRLQESMHLTDGRELKVIDRGQPYAYRWQATYGTDTSYMPTANISATAWQEDSRDTAVISLSLRTSGGAASWPFIRDNPSIDPYSAFLSALPGIE